MHDIFRSNKDPARIDWSISEFLSNMSRSAQARTHLQKAFINCGLYLVRLNFAHQSMARRIMLDPIKLNQTNMRKSKKKGEELNARTSRATSEIPPCSWHRQKLQVWKSGWVAWICCCCWGKYPSNGDEFPLFFTKCLKHFTGHENYILFH